MENIIQDNLPRLLSLYAQYAPSIPFLPSAPTIARYILPKLISADYLSYYSYLSSYLSSATGSRKARPGSATVESMFSSLPNWDITSILLLLGAIYLGLLTLNALRRAVWGWVMMFVKMGFYGGLAVVGLMVWARGGERFWADVVQWAEGVGGVWQEAMGEGRDGGAQERGRGGW